MLAYARYNIRSGIVLVLTIVLSVKCEAQSEAQIENTLRNLFTPEGYPTIQMQALRRDIIRRLQEELQREQAVQDLLDYKGSVSAWARWGNPSEKRNIEALARGGYIKTQPQTPDDPNLKRSEAAQNPELPPFQMEAKRGIQSLARNGDLHRPHDQEDIIDELYGKRNGEEGYDFSPYGKRYLGSLARNGDLYGYHSMNKRSVSQEEYLKGLKQGDMSETSNDKRNIASLKAQGKQKFKRSMYGGSGSRNKRQVDYYDGVNEEYPSPVYQNQNVYDYEELIKALTGSYPNTEKRFLGRLPQMGKPKTTPSPKNRYH